VTFESRSGGLRLQKLGVLEAKALIYELLEAEKDTLGKIPRRHKNAGLTIKKKPIHTRTAINKEIYTTLLKR